MLALGARDALNLDGGGSTTMIHLDRREGDTLRIANRPSDKEGERSVGNALAVITGSRAGSRCTALSGR
jgi:exopolysaccharide biosynthesis protein